MKHNVFYSAKRAFGAQDEFGELDAEAGVGATARRLRVSLEPDADVLEEAEAHEGEQAPQRVLALPARLVQLARCAQSTRTT